MKNVIINIVVATAAFAVTTIIGAEDNKKKLSPQPLLVESSPVVIPIPRPTLKADFCTRTQTVPMVSTEQQTINTDIPLHCLEPNCGLGVYRKKENETVERCSYCEAIKPEKA
jgi:hypothetical protein